MRSIRGKLEYLEDRINEVNADIVFLSETWLDKKDVEEDYQIDDYSLFISNRKISSKKSGGGVAIYVKNKYKIIDSETYCRDGIESVKICIKFKSIKYNFYSVYRNEDTLENTENIIEYLESINKRDNIIVGDFNFPKINWKYKESKDEDFYKFVKKNQLWQHVKQPTRNNNILDLIITSYNLINDVSGVMIVEPIERGDHSGLLFKVHY